MGSRAGIGLVLVLLVAGCDQLLRFASVSEPAVDAAAPDVGEVDGPSPAKDVPQPDVADLAPPDSSEDDASPDVVLGCATLSGGAIYAEGFEGAGPKEIMSSTGIVERVTSPVHCGNWAMRARVDKPPATDLFAAAIWDLSPARGEGDELFVRAYVYIPAGFSPAADGWLILFRVSSVSRINKVSLDLLQGDGIEVVNNIDSGQATPSTVGVVPRDTWVCLELGVGVSETSGWAKVWREGISVAQLQGQDTLPAGGISEVTIGVAHARMTSASTFHEVFVDDVIISTSRIGCN